ncbi:helix-turn-helix domain-containing protein [Brucella pseudogrignonensis]|uniref:helix-turn-helix domain-containing protein n=1 Tax=Brucella pseudogrignonensis TaxID=419475 RepID=UPI003D9919B5
MMRSYEDDRKNKPYNFLNSPDGLGARWLFIENVARMLCVHVDFVRRISREELPVHPLGRRLIYDRADVDRFIESRKKVSTGANSKELSAPRTRRIQAVSSKSFDPVEKTRGLTK